MTPNLKPRVRSGARGRPGLTSWPLWIVILAIVTAAMVRVRQGLSDAPVALAYLLVVLFAGARGGRAMALTMACLSFLLFDWFFLLPYGTLALANPLNWFVLIAFLAASIIATQLFERSRNEAALGESVRVRDEVMASLSHDLRAPLTSIKALAHDIAADGDDRASVIEAEADRLHAMVADGLDLSQLRSRSLQLNIEVNDAEDLVGTALQRIRASWPDRPINVQLETPESPFGRFDFVQTLRVLVNLIDNALKYSASQDPVDIVVRRDGQWLVLLVLDHGDGVSPSERERIFEPFYRPPGMAPDVHGAGLGLSISRALAEAQGGSLTFAARQGGGSVFTLRLPAADIAGSSRVND